MGFEDARTAATRRPQVDTPAEELPVSPGLGRETPTGADLAGRDRLSALGFAHGCVHELWRGEPCGQTVLRGLRQHSGQRLPLVRGRESTREEILWRLRCPAGGRRRDGRRCHAARDRCSAGGRASAGLGAVRRSGRIHDAVRASRRGGGPRVAVAVLRSARTLIERYGGMVEKFIGDAVMAVWGTPARDEDDAERAVRAALDLVAARCAEVGSRAARPGRGADRRGGGDGRRARVRGWSSATRSTPRRGCSPSRSRGRCWSASDAAGERGGDHLRGRRAPRAQGQGGAGAAVAALRVVSGARWRARSRSVSRRRSSVASASCRRSRSSCTRPSQTGVRTCVSLIGIAGIGKSRLAWEFYKYFDGIVETSGGIGAAASPTETAWRTGRWRRWSRTRGRIVGGRAAGAAREKLRRRGRGACARRGRARLVEPRLAHLLGLEERAGARPAGPVRGWRLFFERMATPNPVVLAFEDLQWADTACSTSSTTCSSGRRVSALRLALGRRSCTSGGPAGAPASALQLALPRAASERRWRQLLDGLVPGLPQRARGADPRARGGGPAVRGRDGPDAAGPRAARTGRRRYRADAACRDLDVPETLQALIAARLDGLTPAERPAAAERRRCSASRSRGRRSPRSAALPSRSSSRCSTALVAQGGARACMPIRARPSAASTASCRTSSDGRVRDARPASAGRGTSPRPAHLEQASPGGRGRRGARVALSGRVDAAPDADDAPEIRAKARDMLPRRRTRRFPRCDRKRPSATSTGR